MYIIFAIISTFIFFSTAALAEQLKFVQVTDVHLSINGCDKRGRSIEDSQQIFKSAVESINSLPDINFIAFSGDNIDSAEENNLIKFCETIKNLNKPYYIGIGNHDVFSSRLNKSNYFDILKKYNKSQKTGDSNYYFFPNKDFIVIFMDGVIQTIPCAHGCYNERELDWLDEILTKYNNKKAILIQHFPIVEPTDNKSHRLRRAKGYQNLLTKHKNIVAIVSGHYHYEKTAFQDGIWHISSPAIVQHPNEYRVIEINYEHDSLFSENPKFELKTEIIQISKPASTQTN